MAESIPEQWADQARYDLDTARAMLASERYLYVMFCGQQAVEKMLKAVIAVRTGQCPPRLHNLLRLAERAGIDFNPSQTVLMEDLSRYYIQGRYPDEISALLRGLDRQKGPASAESSGGRAEMAVVDAVIADRAVEAVRVIGRWGRVRAAYLFGSQVQGTADQWSDIDIAVFVEGAEEWDFERLSHACGAAQRRAGLDIEMHVLPAAWYENPPRASFAQYILSHGVPLEFDVVERQAE